MVTNNCRNVLKPEPHLALWAPMVQTQLVLMTAVPRSWGRSFKEDLPFSLLFLVEVFMTLAPVSALI